MPKILKSPLILLINAIAFGCMAQNCLAADEDRIRQLIQSSEIVPLDYRQQINIVANNDTVLISVYKDPDAQANDCKIDAILMSEKVLEAVPGMRKVSVFFYDLAADDKLWQVDVPTASVAAFAHGALSKSGILKAAHLSTKQSNTLANSYSGQTYKEILQRLGVIDGPSQHQRAVTLVRIDDLGAHGKDITDLKRKYLHIEDLARRGDVIVLHKELKELTGTLDQLDSGDNREAKLDSISSVSSRPTE